MDNFVIASLNVGGHTEAMDFEKTDQWHKLLELTYAAWRVADIAIENEFLKSKVKQTAAEILVEYPNALGNRMKMEELSSRIRSQRALLSLAQKTSNSRELNFTILKNEYHKIGTVVTQLMPPVATEQHHYGVPKKGAPVLSESAGWRRSYKTQSSEAIGRVAAESQKQQEKVVDNMVEVRSAERPETHRAERSEVLTERQKKIFQFFSKRKGEKIRLKEIAQVFPDLTDRTVRNDLRDLCTKKLIVRSDGHGQASFYKLV
ncbi:DeoR family transcriptional regulator [Candidatus Azambacteria bacterium]|nr:DeoR family transcriptional regulator [Candidatus Azambacteria bacterium]